MCLTLCDPMNCSPPGSSVHGDSPGKTMESLPCPSSGDLPSQGSSSPLLCLLHWQVCSLPLVPSEKPLFTSAAAAKSLQSCPTLRSRRRQPTRLPRPWDSPGKNTGVGCHFLLQCVKVKSESEVAQSCPIHT